MYYIYWIRRKNHTDPFSEGYIGFSCNPESRFEQHLKASLQENTDSRVYNCIRKYRDELIFDVLEEYENKERALKRENEYRPTKWIGWNIAPGGQVPPEIKNDETVKQKISKTIKSMGFNPYCESTHSEESKQKRRQTIKLKDYKWIHNPNTLESRLIATALEDIPQGWEPGRKPKLERKKKIRGIDYESNARSWLIKKNGEYLCETINMAKWCSENDLPYLHNKKRTYNKLIDSKSIQLAKSENNTVIENGFDTNLNQKEYAVSRGLSKSFVSNKIRKGFYIQKQYDVYEIQMK